jgi:NAD(P)-dependent dehydrogenase (short-subunit alcohol dehydrogenase family)
MGPDRVVLLTGAANGIGRAMAASFHQDGFAVVAVDNDAAGLAAVAPACALTTVADVADPAQVEAAVAATVARLGRVDVLVNGAGVILDRRVTEHGEAEFERVVRINLFGAFYFMRATIPVMRRRRYGRIVNFASRAAENATPGLSAYGASKAGLFTLTQCAAAEVAGDGILVNALIPGDTRTAMNPTAKQEPEAVYPYLRELATLPPGGPTGKVFRYGAEYPLFQPKGDGRPVALPPS